MKAVFAGERGAFGELAAKEYFGSKCGLESVPEFADVFNAVMNGVHSFGIVPIENSLAGSIHQNYDMLLESNLHITGEVLLRVGHFLIANKGVNFKRIKKVYSHPQALAQCKKFLKSSGLEPVPCSNTAAAVRKIKDEGINDAAAIGSMQAAIEFDMKVLRGNIEDNQWNTTRFLILSRTPNKLKSSEIPQKTSIVFSTKNIPGALFKCLAVFALRDIDLFKIESRPVNGNGFKYLFYLDFRGDLSDEARKNAINHLQEITTFYRHLGSYPVGKVVHPKFSGAAAKHPA